MSRSEKDKKSKTKVIQKFREAFPPCRFACDLVEKNLVHPGGTGAFWRSGLEGSDWISQEATYHNAFLLHLLDLLACWAAQLF